MKAESRTAVQFSKFDSEWGEDPPAHCPREVVHAEHFTCYTLNYKCNMFRKVNLVLLSCSNVMVYCEWTKLFYLACGCYFLLLTFSYFVCIYLFIFFLSFLEFITCPWLHIDLDAHDISDPRECSCCYFSISCTPQLSHRRNSTIPLPVQCNRQHWLLSTVAQSDTRPSCTASCCIPTWNWDASISL